MSIENDIESKIEEKYKNNKNIDIILGDNYSFD